MCPKCWRNGSNYIVPPELFCPMPYWIKKEVGQNNSGATNKLNDRVIRGGGGVIRNVYK